MKTPDRLETLVAEGIVQEVVRPLMSGKEAQIYLVRVEGEEYVAKVYKEASERTFKHRTQYTEGRRTRNSRDQRAVNKRSRHGRKLDESAWRSTEVDMIYRLRDAGVRVPEPINFVDGVLVMELVKNAEGEPAPRLGDLRFSAAEALAVYQQLLQEVVRMLCAGVIHGDLSDFNVLMGADGPVLIDFPQAVDPANNQSARKLLLRDVDNLHRFLERFCPDQPTHAYAQEMWSLYESNRLRPESKLLGDYRAPEGKADTEEVLALIEDANLDEQARREGRPRRPPEESGPTPLRRVVDFSQETRPRQARADPAGNRMTSRSSPSRGPAPKPQDGDKASLPNGSPAPKKRRPRRRRKSRGQTGTEASASEARSETKPAQQPASPERPNIGKRRRRRRRSTSPTGEANASAQGDAKRPTGPANPSRNAHNGPKDGAGPAPDRPRRRRRRRPRRSPPSGTA